MFVSVQTLIEFIKNHFYVRSIKFLKSILDSNLYINKCRNKVYVYKNKYYTSNTFFKAFKIKIKLCL